MFSLIENENKTGSWLTMPIFFRNQPKLRDFISTPSIDIVPEMKKNPNLVLTAKLSYKLNK